MTFAQWRNRLTTHFSLNIPVVKRRMTVLLPLSIYSILSFPSGHPVDAYDFFLVFLNIYLCISASLNFEFSCWMLLIMNTTDVTYCSHRKSNKMQQCIKINFIFMWSSTCFGRHTAHHQELKTALAASGFSYVEGCWTCSCWTRPATTRPTTFHACKTRRC